MTISQKIAATGLVPLFAVLVLLSLGAVDRLRQRGSLLHLQSNLAAFESLSATIDALQTERGRTAMFLAGGCPREDLTTARKTADASLEPLGRTAGAAELSSQDRETAAALARRLEAMRAQYAVTNAALRAQAIEAYTALIGELRAVELALVHTPGSSAYAKPLTSMTLLELAKERNGQLRARGSSLLAVNRPLSEEDSMLILRLMSDVVGTLASPAMILGESQRDQLVNQIAAAVDQQASTTKGVAGNISQASLGVADANQRVAQTSSVSTEIARDVAAVGTSVGEIRHGGTQVNDNATRVAKLAEHLGSLVSRFKVEANAQN